MERRGGGIGRRFSRLMVAGLCLLAAGCSPLYVLRAGYEEAKILSRRKSISRLVADSTTPPPTREKLRLVLEARDFASDSLGLDAGKSYTTFSRLDSDTLALIVSAAHRDRFEAYTWWFPIVGRVPYKGYFSERRAREAVEDLQEKGLDTYLRPTSAFSTLGWFNDPLVSPLLRYDSINLAGTVIHEITHNTIYLSGQAAFNESFAEFVGGRGAVAFFCGRYGEASRECATATAAWADALVFGAFLDGLVAELEALYARADLPYDEKLRLREEIFEGARRSFVEEVRPRFRVSTYASFTRDPLNNATLLSRRLYYHRLELFEEVYRRSGGELRRALELILAAARERPDDPYGAVEGLLGGLPAEPALGDRGAGGAWRQPAGGTAGDAGGILVGSPSPLRLGNRPGDPLHQKAEGTPCRPAALDSLGEGAGRRGIVACPGGRLWFLPGRSSPRADRQQAPLLPRLAAAAGAALSSA